ncbi:hypothetical protein V9L05_02170 [Bernardetia sp. Wsw4-3y2]|uniref:hypothetical protein n=1 Tax=Bernardetia sp. Wsw4-3y2 TaxID=3127471 RepID=UPI0030CC41A7
MKNISIRKAIGICYLGLSLISASAAFSVDKIIVKLGSSPFTLLFVVIVICAALCFLSFTLWTITRSLITRYLGYIISFSIFLVYIGAAFSNEYAHSFKDLEAIPIFLSPVTFLSLFSYSKIGFLNKKRKDENIEILDSEMLHEEEDYSKKHFYFWSVSRIYATTIFVFALPLLVISIFSPSIIKGVATSEIALLFVNIIATLFWLKPKWARIIFIILSSIALIGGVIFIFAAIFGSVGMGVEGLITAFGMCVLLLGLILILISKEAKAELIEFEKKKS